MTIKAKEILKNKFWIVESGNNKIGTLSYDEDRYMLSTPLTQKFFKDKKTLKKELGNTIFYENVIEVQSDFEVHGYPTNVAPKNAVYNVKQKLPLFTKSKKAKQPHAPCP